MGSHIKFGLPQIYSRTSDRSRRNLAIQARLRDGPLHQPIQTLLELVGF